MTITRKADALTYDQTFLATIRRGLRAMGEPPTVQQLLDGVTVETRLGPLYLHYRPTEKLGRGREYSTGWLAARFEDVARAKAFLCGTRFNPYSGKWNWMELDPYLIQALRELRPTETA